MFVFGCWLTIVDVQDVTNGHGAQYLRSRAFVFGEVHKDVRLVFFVALCLLSEHPPKGTLLFMGENGLKVLLTGDSGVGKSSVLVRFTDDHFDAE